MRSIQEVIMLAQTKYSEIPAFQAPTSELGSGLTFPAHIGRQKLFGCVELSGATMTFDRNAEIFGDGEPAEYIYKVASGAVRTYKIFNDGRRQIGAFHLAGDVFGIEPGEDHSC